MGAGTSCVWKFNDCGCAPIAETSGNTVANASNAGDTPAYDVCSEPVVIAMKLLELVAPVIYTQVLHVLDAFPSASA